MLHDPIYRLKILFLESARVLLRVRQTAIRLLRRLAPSRRDGNRVYFHQRVTQYREIWSRCAATLGARFIDLEEDIWQVDLQGRSTRIVNHQLQFDDPVTLNIAADKRLMHKLLADAGLPVPPYAVFQLAELDRAYAFLAEHPEGCVVKPVSGAAGRGVSTYLQARREVRRAAVLASLYGRRLMIEAQIPGECYRILVLGGKAVNVVCRRGPRLRGNGRDTVRRLIAQDNAARAARHASLLPIDRDCSFTLGWQGLSLEAVPEPDREFLVRSIPAAEQRIYQELRTVYNTNLTGKVHQDLVSVAERAAAVLGSEFVGVDLILPDPGVPLGDSGGVINEVNTTPAVHHHYDSRSEPYPEVALAALAALLGVSTKVEHSKQPPRYGT